MNTHEIITCGVRPLGFVLGAVPPDCDERRTPEEARAWLGYQGISVAQWAREHSFSDQLVREVLAGRKRCLRGQCHNIALALGMKEGTPTDRPGRVPPAPRPTAGSTR